jgi:ATP-dependent DNA ligase
MRLSRRAEPFDSDQFIFELKIDGFRALAHINAGQGELVSRSGNTFKGFAELATWIAQHVHVKNAVIDGEIACIDDSGRPVFRDLLFRKVRMFHLVVAKQAPPQARNRSNQIRPVPRLHHLTKPNDSAPGLLRDYGP